MYVSSRISVQTLIAKRCDVVAKIKINFMKLIFISAQAKICHLNVKHSGRSKKSIYQLRLCLSIQKQQVITVA